MEIFKLFGSVFIEDNEAHKKIDDIDKKAEGTGSTLGSMIGTAAKWGAGLAAGASVAVGGLMALASQASDAASEINDMSVRTGLSTTTLQELKFATGQVGVNFESITGAVGKLTRTMSGAEEGGAKAQAAFDKLGIKTSDVDGKMRSMDSIFPEVIKKLAGMSNESERNALAMDFFGKGAVELVPLLAQGGAGIDQLSKQAHDLGLVMSEDAISAGDQFGDSMDALKESFGAIVAKLGVELMPAFQALMDWVMGNMPSIQSGIQTSMGVASDTISWLGDNVLPIVTGAFGFFSDAIKFVTDNANILIPVVVGLTAAIAAQSIIDTIVGFIKAWQTATKTQTTLQWLLNVALNANPLGLVALAIGAVIAAGVLLYQNWDTVKAFAYQLWDVMKEVFGGIKDFIVGVWDDIWAGIKWTLNAISGGINILIRGLNSLQIDVPEWVPGMGGKSFGIHIPEIPMLAKGGDITKGGLAIVGEQGTELVELPDGATVHSHSETDRLLNDNGNLEINVPVSIQGPIYGVDDLENTITSILKLKAVPILVEQLRQPVRARG